MASLNEAPSRQKGAILMCLSAFLFSAMQIPINMSGASIPIMEQVFFRNIVTLFLSFILIKRAGGSLFGTKKNQPLLQWGPWGLHGVTGRCGWSAVGRSVSLFQVDNFHPRSDGLAHQGIIHYRDICHCFSSFPNILVGRGS